MGDRLRPDLPLIMDENLKSKPMIVLRPEWGGVFAWLRNPDRTHDALGFSSPWGGRFLVAVAPLARKYRDIEV